ncbi:MAG: phage tail protein [Turneriella sp.]
MTHNERISLLEARLEKLEKRRHQRSLLWISIAMAIPFGLWAATTVPNVFADGETLSAAKLNANFQALADAGSVPAGTIVAFGGSTPPSGWLLCDGSQVSRSTYSSLYTAIGNAYGSGDGSSSFHLPDFRGRFLRGVDGSANVDPDKATRTAMNAGGNTGNLVGSVQGHQFNNHRHAARKGDNGGNCWFGNCGNGFGALGGEFAADGGYIYETIGTPRQLISFEGGNETRPVNAYVIYIIKH